MIKTVIIQNEKVNNGKKIELKACISQEIISQQATEIFFHEHYKPDKKGKVCLDIGANIGLASLYLKDYAEEIHAIEPSYECYQCLVENTKDYNIKTYPIAIGTANEKRKLFGKEDEPPQTFYNNIFNNYTYNIDVESLTIDRFMDENNINHVDIMKIDVEGAEYEIFMSPGFEKVADKIDFIIGEAHVLVNCFPMAIPEILKTYGFETEFKQLKEPNYIYHISFENPEINYKKQVNIPMNTIFVARKT
mgnify:CR=1 FL=1